MKKGSDSFKRHCCVTKRLCYDSVMQVIHLTNLTNRQNSTKAWVKINILHKISPLRHPISYGYHLNNMILMMPLQILLQWLSVLFKEPNITGYRKYKLSKKSVCA